MSRLAPALALAVLAAAPLGAAALNAWQEHAQLPDPRTEVAAAVVSGEIVVAGGFNADGSHSARVDAYSPSADRWRRLPDLPRTTHHAMAVGHRGRVYVLGGYGSDGQP
jgi:N-acetylneuraminic acid mutarotase